MHLGKAYDQLWEIVNDDSAIDLAKYAIASALLDGFDRAARDSNGNVTNGYAREKIDNVRGWITMLCGIGENGYDDLDQVAMNLRGDLGKLKLTIAGNGISLQ